MGRAFVVSVARAIVAVLALLCVRGAGAEDHAKSIVCKSLAETASLLTRDVPTDLRSLSVVGPLFDDVALLRFAGCERLGRITLDSTSVTRAGVTRLRQQLPDVDVHATFEWATDTFKSCGRGDPWSSYNPATVVRAVNYLRSQRKTQAIGFLRHYVRNSSFLEQDCLLNIVPLSFKRRKSADATEQRHYESLSPFASPISDVVSGKNDVGTQFCGDLIVEDDIPFLSRWSVFHPGFRRGGPPENREYLIDWVAVHGKLIKRRLKPGNPRDAAQAAAAKYAAGYAKDMESEKSELESSRILFSRQAKLMMTISAEPHEWSDSLQEYVKRQPNSE